MIYVVFDIEVKPGFRQMFFKKLLWYTNIKMNLKNKNTILIYFQVKNIYTPPHSQTPSQSYRSRAGLSRSAYTETERQPEQVWIIYSCKHVSKLNFNKLNSEKKSTQTKIKTNHYHHNYKVY